MCFDKILKNNFPYLSNGPVDAFSHALFEQSLGNGSRGVDQGADEVVVVTTLNPTSTSLWSRRDSEVVGFHLRNSRTGWDPVVPRVPV